MSNLDYFDQVWNISYQISLAVMKKPRQTAFAKVFGGSKKALGDLIESYRCIFVLNYAKYKELKVGVFVFKQLCELTGG